MRCSLLIHDGIEMDKTIVTSLKLASLMQKNRRLKVWNESTISTVLYRAISATTRVGPACAKKANTLLTLILHRFLRSCHSLPSLVHAPSSIEYITRWMCFDVYVMLMFFCWILACYYAHCTCNASKRAVEFYFWMSELISVTVAWFVVHGVLDHVNELQSFRRRCCRKKISQRQEYAGEYPECVELGDAAQVTPRENCSGVVQCFKEM